MTGDRLTIPVVLMTTADMRSGRESELRRLVQSVERFHRNRPDVSLRHYMLLQRCADAAPVCAQLGFPERMTVTAIDRQVPLSTARNLMINALLADPPAGFDDALVAWPDDDAWYPDGVLEYILSRFETDRELDLWFCRYGMGAALPATIEEASPSLQQTISRASSNTISVRGSVLRACGGFDESLGLGTPAKSGEDTDFAMRSYFAARKAAFAPCVMIGHREFDPKIRAGYYTGSLVAIRRHMTASSAARLAFARKLLVGLALVGRRDLSFAALAAAWKACRTHRTAINPARQWQ